MELFAELERQIHPIRLRLMCHPVYFQVRDLRSLQRFMENHVFAVLDFMTLLKTLQRCLTCIETPWTPVTDTLAARLINETVLAEESDEISPGCYSSHFDLYIKAMKEVGAHIGHIQDFVGALKKGITAKEALSSLPIHDSTKTFVLKTLEASKGLTHEVAAVFLFGREEIIPDMFRKIVTALEQRHDKSYYWFHLYLNRHIELDGDKHAPMARKLLSNLCGSDPIKWEQARCAAEQALHGRIALWDGLINTPEPL